jgi:hypothetical protein
MLANEAERDLPVDVSRRRPSGSSEVERIDLPHRTVAKVSRGSQLERLAIVCRSNKLPIVMAESK